MKMFLLFKVLLLERHQIDLCHWNLEMDTNFNKFHLLFGLNSLNPMAKFLKEGYSNFCRFVFKSIDTLILRHIKYT